MKKALIILLSVIMFTCIFALYGCGSQEECTHVFDAENVDEKYLKSAEDCENPAVYYRSCNACGEKGSTTFTCGEAKGHKFEEKNTDEKYLKSEANCSECAVYYYSCLCGKIGEESFDFGSKNESIHAFDDNSTCTLCDMKISCRLNPDGLGYTITGIEGALTEKVLVIPSRYKELPITSIGSFAFFGCTELEDLVIPDGIKTVESFAFKSCTGLISVLLPGDADIEDFAFDNTVHPIYNYIEREKEIKPLRQDIYKEVNGCKMPLNVFTPRENNKNNKYAVLCIHGGSWTSNFKKNEEWTGNWMRHNARQFAENGYYAFEITHRSIGTNGADLTEVIKDVKDAAAYCREVLMPEFGIDELIIIGDSAGAHLALCIALTEDAKNDPYAVIACNPVSNCVNTKWTGGLETEAEQMAASPYHLVKNTTTKFLIMHGNADTVVDINDSIKLNERLNEVGCDSELAALNGDKHAFILYGYTTPPERISQHMGLVLQYLDSIT